MIWLARQWRSQKVVYVFFIIEFFFTIPALVLFALADPDEYRTRLWEDGYKNGFNSSPKQQLYAYANYQNPKVPLVWSWFLTTFNVVIAVLSMFILLIKAVMLILHLWLPILSFLVHGGVAAVWAYSVYAQTSPDMSDPKQPNPGAPWYITKSCSVAYYQSNVGYCGQAKACLVITVLQLAIFTANTFFAAICAFPSKKERDERRREAAENADLEKDDDDDDMEAQGEHSDENSIEMEHMAAKRNFTVSTIGVKSPAYPPGTATTQNIMTPRSTAFNRLGGTRGDLPLRQ